MEAKMKFIFYRIFLLFIVSFIIAVIFYLLVSFETNQPKMVHYSHLETFIMLPLMYSLWFFPFVLLVGLPATIVSAIIKTKFRVKNRVINIAIYIIIACFITPFLPNMVNELASNTSYKFLINPYYILPTFGAITLGFLENLRNMKDR